MTEHRESSQGAEVIDLMEALRASVQQRKRAVGKAGAAPDAPKARKTARRATAAAPAPAPARRAAGKK